MQQYVIFNALKVYCIPKEEELVWSEQLKNNLQNYDNSKFINKY